MDAAALAIPHHPVPAEQVVAGSPSTGMIEFSHSIGVWEHTPGTSTDLESDEIFVVLSGSAMIAFDDRALEPIDLRPGSVARLTAGMRTTWTVRETIRKIYVME